ncbi:MAG: hypothetical protein AABX54_02165 [Nanoarchaeota archaeon]
MKKEKLCILFLALLLIPNIIAIEITLSKESYQPRETMQAQITGTFISLSSDNILIYEGDKVHSEPVIKALTKQNNIYYFYALLPNRESNFSLRIENTEYISSGEIKTSTIIKDFSIKKTNESALSINPGFILSNKDFSIKIKPLSNQKLSATLEASGQTKNLSLIEEREETLKFSVSNLYSNTNLKINNYNIPVFIFKKQPDSNVNVSDIIRLDFSPPELRAKVLSGESYSFNIILQNSGNIDLSNITISNNLNAVIFPVSIKSFKAGNSVYLNITLLVPLESKANISGFIIIKSAENNFSVPIMLEIAKTQKEVNLTQTGLTTSLNCINIGKICLNTQKCSGELTSSIEGPCCKGDCTEQKATNYSTIIGIILVVIVIGLLAFVYFKSKQKQKLKSTDEIYLEKSKKFEDRMSGEEVSGRLGRI